MFVFFDKLKNQFIEIVSFGLFVNSSTKKDENGIYVPPSLCSEIMLRKSEEKLLWKVLRANNGARLCAMTSKWRRRRATGINNIYVAVFTVGAHTIFTQTRVEREGERERDIVPNRIEKLMFCSVYVRVRCFHFILFFEIRIRNTTNYAIPECFSLGKHSPHSGVDAVRWHNRRRGFAQDENKNLYCCFYLCCCLLLFHSCISYPLTLSCGCRLSLFRVTFLVHADETRNSGLKTCSRGIKITATTRNK